MTIHLKKTGSDQSLKKSSCKCASIKLLTAAFWNNRKHKTACWYLRIFPCERLAEMTWTAKRDNQLFALLKPMCTNKRANTKALCISKYAHFSLLCYVAGARRKAMWTEGSHILEMKSSRKIFPTSPVWKFGPTFQPNVWSVRAVPSCFIHFQSPARQRVCPLTTCCGHTKAWRWSEKSPSWLKFRGYCFEVLQNDKQNMFKADRSDREVFSANKTPVCVGRGEKVSGCLTPLWHTLCFISEIICFQFHKMKFSLWISSEWAKKEALLCTYFCN